MFKTLVILVLIINSTFSLLELNSRIVGGDPADQEQFPYQASIRRKDRHRCGGSIVSPTKIITAAHCIHEKYRGKYKVRVGIYLVNEQGQEFRVTEEVLHPGYDEDTAVNDLAVLTLEKPMEFSHNVQTIALRSYEAVPKEPLTVSGWGKTTIDASGPPSPILQYLTVQAIEIRKCKRILKRVNFPVMWNHLCATSSYGRGFCKGDSGGPLVDAERRLIGVVSWAKPCAKGAPEVYTSIPHHYEWLLEQL